MCFATIIATFLPLLTFFSSPRPFVVKTSPYFGIPCLSLPLNLSISLGNLFLFLLKIFNLFNLVFIFLPSSLPSLSFSLFLSLLLSFSVLLPSPSLPSLLLGPSSFSSPFPPSLLLCPSSFSSPFPPSLLLCPSSFSSPSFSPSLRSAEHTSELQSQS